MKKTDEYQTIRIWVRTQRRLKLIAALTHESIVAVLDRLSLDELQRLQGKEDTHVPGETGQHRQDPST